jgi:hypothetical protein
MQRGHVAHLLGETPTLASEVVRVGGLTGPVH